MKKVTKLATILFSIALLLTGCNNSSSNSDISTSDSSIDNTSTISESKGIFDPGDYYSSIDSSLSGNSLKTALNTLNNSKRKRVVGYDGLRYTYQIFDRDWKGQDNGKVVGFYDNALVGPSWDSGKTWNREHVWPKSRGGNNVESDAHMARPTSTDINSARGNKLFAESGAYDPGSEGVKNYRGITARIIFYCLIADTQLGIVDSTETSGKNMGKLSDLLKWNLQYLPSTSEDAPLELRVEQNRNKTIAEHARGQGNRNPFIDHPEYACKIWGSTNSNTKKICGIK